MQLLDYGSEFTTDVGGGWVVDRRCPHLVKHNPHYWKWSEADKHRVYLCPGYPAPEDYEGAAIHHFSGDGVHIG